MLRPLAVLIGSLALQAAGAVLLTRGATALARRMGVSTFFVGLTIVGFGTSTPELFTSLTAALQDRGAIVVGNVIGSNIFNIGMILGLAALLCPVPVRVPVVRREVFIVLAVAPVPLLALLSAQRLERWLGLVMRGGLALYLWRGYQMGKRHDGDAAPPDPLARPTLPPAQAVGVVVAGLGLLVAGSHLLIDSASTIARALGASELTIGLTIVAAGTSSPELMTSVVAAARRQPDIAVGNVLGSNVFNLLGILGLTAVVAPVDVGTQALALDVPVMIAASAALLPIVTSRARISRFEGVVLCCAYVGYVVVLFAVAPGWFAAN
ncbi:MAG: calcium/sodium antiporter [Planctomycetota bacterium]|jgi:cation:H+ antiporter